MSRQMSEVVIEERLEERGLLSVVVVGDTNARHWHRGETHRERLVAQDTLYGCGKSGSELAGFFRRLK
jgi:hypothetical protein